MRHRILERAAAAGVALSLVVATAALADTVRGDADTLTGGIQGSRDLGAVAPGAVVDVPVGFELACASVQHVDPGQSVVISYAGGTVPPGGSVAMEPVTVGPVPTGWAADGEWCSDQVPIVATGTVRVTAPTTPGLHLFSLQFDRALTPAGAADEDAFGFSVTAADVVLTVVEAVNTPPVLALPADMAVTADGPGGWTASYAVSATDVEDDPDPTPTCAPAVGAVLPLGQTTVECSVTDAGGLTATGSFIVTVSAAEPAPGPVVPAPVTAVFGAPVQADGLDGRAGRTIPLKVRLMAGEESIGEGSLVLAVAPCAGGDRAAELEMDWRAGSERWFGLLRTRGLEAGCYAVRAFHDGVDVGGFELRLLDQRPDVAKEKADVAKQKPAAARERSSAAPPKPAAAKARAGAAGRGADRRGGH